MDRSHHIRIAPANTPTLVREWLLTKRAFQAFQNLPETERYSHLGKLFERVEPWIKRGIRVAVVRHFLVLPEEFLLARLFAKAAKRDALHDTHEAFGLWIESRILRDLADPEDQLGVVNGASGEPSAELQGRFNQLPTADRAILFLYLIEKRNPAQVARATGILPAEIRASLLRIWQVLTRGIDELHLPKGWRAPEFLAESAVQEQADHEQE